MIAATADMEEGGMVTLVLRRTTCDVVQRAGTLWKMTVVTTDEAVVVAAVADGADQVGVVRKGPAMIVVGVG